jgi:hypothetical protein
MDINKEPLVPTVKPKGMPDQEFEEHLKEAINLHDQWLYQHIDELSAITEEHMWNIIQNDERERLSTIR